MDAAILERTKKCVAEILALEVDEIEPASRLIDDLGADSLDLVELMFGLEVEFGVRITREDMSLSAQLGLPEEEIHDNEVLTPRALELLRERFPGAGEVLREGATRRHLAALLTVEEVARTVERKLGRAQGAA